MGIIKYSYPCLFCFALLLSFCSPKQEREKGRFYAVQKNGKWGYEDHNGNVVIDYTYDQAGPFSANRAVVMLDHKYLLIDETGKAVTKKYDDLERINSNWFAAGKYGEMELIDIQGKVIADSLDRAYTFTKDTTLVVLKKSTDKDKGYNIADRNGKLVLPMWLEAPGSQIFEKRTVEGLSAIPEENDKLILVSYNKWGGSRYAYMSDKGKLVTDTSYDNGIGLSDGYGYLCRNTDDMMVRDYFIFDSLGNNLCTIRAEKILEIIPAYGLITADTRNGECVYELRTGKKISGPYNQIGDGSVSGGLGFSFGGSSIVKVSSRSADYRGFSEGFIHFYQGARKGGYLDSTGKTAIAPVFDGVNPFCEGMARVSRYDRQSHKQLIGFINKKGDLVIPYQYDSAEDFKKGIAVVEKDNTKFKIDKTGSAVAEK